ncbi:hypothetical protein [Homoserinibacter sp. GY 40078]|uniref:DUF7455 domain-containing protein n=1 Tax=Homoserinibacter sp. GY 40078 TaxID=2603275 RepID=UPI0011C8C760|nr:hypothetical protein [Homoserinibacter sp. GY 40078]TXK17482.1 hypothetical protein FVQ89_11700 [Homoserinibacter sp. GY 40078]
MSQIASDGTVELERPALSALDRCDMCGAQAYVRVTLASGELLFCAHHGTEYKPKLIETALDWHDESSRLQEPVAE